MAAGGRWLQYRLQIYKPRSVDPTETALLVPIGAAHSDNFDVATISGVAGVQPYLHLPTGTNGTMDPVSKNVTTGTRIVSVGDSPLGSNAIRWVTAFLGDAAGRNRLKGCKAVLSEQTAPAGTWNPIFTGRVGNYGLDGMLKFSFEIKSSVDDLNRKKIFVYDPHPNATYAFRTAIYPPRLVKSWGSGTIPAGAWLSATVSNKYTDANGLTHGLLELVNTGEDLTSAAMVTKQGLAFSAGLAPGSVFLKVTAGGASGLFRVAKHTRAYRRGTNKKNVFRQWLVEIGPLDEIPSTHPLHMVLPANGTAVTCYVQGNDRTPVSEEAPVFVDNVHPLQLWADILDGNFGIIDDTTGSARPIAPRDTSPAGPWDYTNSSSPSFSMSNLPGLRFIITQPEKANDWIIANICKPLNLSYRVDGQGRVIPLDLRPTSSTAVTGTVGDSDLTELPTQWTVDGSKALLGVELTYYVDAPKQSTPANLYDNSPDPYPDIGAAAQIESRSQSWIVLNPLLNPTRDAGDQLDTVDAQGLRLIVGEFTGPAGIATTTDRLSPYVSAQQDTLAPYAGGAVTVPLSFNRDSDFATNAKGQPGQFWTIQVSTLPDPTTNQRGGPRVGLCLTRVEQGLKVLTTFLDVGSASPAAVPTIGTLSITNGGLDVPITVNAAGDPVQVEYIVTVAGTSTRPIPTDPGWTIVGSDFLFPILTTTKRQANVPAGTRLWARARSRPTGNGLKLPSAYVFPSAGSPAGSIDVGSITAPTIGVATGVTGNRATVPWTNGDATKVVEVFLNAGGIPGGGWTDAMRVQPTLPAGSTSVQLRNLTPSVTYGVAVRHRDEVGGFSNFSATTFATTGTPSTAPLAPPLGIGGGGGTTGTGIDVAPITPGPRIDVPVGITLLLNPGDPAMKFEIQHAPDSSGSPNVGAATSIATNLPGIARAYHDQQPLDGATHWYRVRHVGYGDTPGPWNDWVSATARVQGVDDADIATVVRNQDGDGNGQRQFKIRGQGRSLVQTLTYEIPNAEFDIWESASQPHAWTVDTGDSSSVAQDTATVFSGDSSAHYSFGAGGSAGTFRGLTTNELTKGAWCIPLQPGAWYRFKFASRVSSIANGPSYRVTLTHDVGGTFVTQSTFAYRAGAKWQIDILKFLVPLGAGPLTKLAIEFSRNATTATDFWIDGVRLQDIGTQRCVILTAGTSWTVPSDFNPANNTVELWGGGGGGAPGTTNANGGGGGGGGGYRYQKNFDPGSAATVAYVIGGGGAASTAGGDTTWNSAAVTAKGGSGASGSSGGLGGTVGSGGTGGTVGGTGGAGRVGTSNSGGGGGGGAAGSVTANGGGAGTNVAAGAGGQGGTGVQSNASATGGAAGTAGGGAGGNAAQITSTDDSTAAGAGGGGGGTFSPSGAGTGGQYGGGGGGGGASSSVGGSGGGGKQGCIVLSWITTA